MIDVYTSNNNPSVQVSNRYSAARWWFMYLCLLGSSIALTSFMALGNISPAVIVWLLYLSGITAIVLRPEFGIYLIVLLTLTGDSVLVPWYPFAKNFSSSESILFLNNSLIINPLETYIIVTAVAWLARVVLTRQLAFRYGPLFWPAVAFLGFVTYGLVYGLGSGGNVVMGLWESRAIYYLAAMLILVTNLIRTRQQVNILIWSAMIGLFGKSVFGVVYIINDLHFDVSNVESIAEHAMSVHFISYFALTIAVWLFSDTIGKRLILPFMFPTILYVFFANHRRAGFLTLGIVIFLLIVMVYKQNRKLFWWVAPALTVIAVAYTLAFWNASGALGMPARAVKSVIGQANDRDNSSNVYREIENKNIMFTIKATPLRGVGFGQKFYIVYPMPDISKAFAWWEYITHNSIMWVWMKIGVGGFYAFLFLIGLSMIIGGRTIWEMPNGSLRVAAITATMYLVAHFTFAYVDMSWDNTSLMYVGTMMGLLNCLERVAAVPIPVQAARWPWLAQNNHWQTDRTSQSLPPSATF